MNSLAITFEGITESLCTAANYVERGVVQFGDSVSDVLDAHLHPKIAYVVKNALMALPLTLALQFAPHPIPFGIIATYWLISLVGWSLDTNVDRVISTGIGMHYVANAITNLAACIFTPNMASGIGFALYGLLGLFWIPIPKNT